MKFNKILSLVLAVLFLLSGILPATSNKVYASVASYESSIERLIEEESEFEYTVLSYDNGEITVEVTIKIPADKIEAYQMKDYTDLWNGRFMLDFVYDHDEYCDWHIIDKIDYELLETDFELSCEDMGCYYTRNFSGHCVHKDFLSATLEYDEVNEEYTVTRRFSDSI